MSYTHIILDNGVLYEMMAQINKSSVLCAALVLHHLYGGLVVILHRQCAAPVNAQRHHQFEDLICILHGVDHGDVLRFRCRHRHFALLN